MQRFATLWILDTLLAAYAIEGAIVNHRENETGSLAAGKAADFIILDRNELDAGLLHQPRGVGDVADDLEVGEGVAHF
ncbi:MAG TPA: hypothetical protein VL049_19080 [Candidatus Dormibacteraeota bacterium]|nr:hypothetical protein [Candidatus Dormibacteraeota bacterium]